MITSIAFDNFRLLHDAVLPLGPFTLLVGPNSSGKSSALAALRALDSAFHEPSLNLSAGPTRETRGRGTTFSFTYRYHYDDHDYQLLTVYDTATGNRQHYHQRLPGEEGNVPTEARAAVVSQLKSARIYSLDSHQLAQAVQLTPIAQLNHTGLGLANVLDRLRDDAPERFARLNSDLSRWLPEFDQILFRTPQTGVRGISLRRASDRAVIQAEFLSQGTLAALALLTLSHLPDPPALIGLEEPDRGIHPRLLRDVRDAIYRLSYPSPEDERDPVQVVMTTHSPYLLDLFRDHPEEIVLAQRSGNSISFERLSDRKDLEQLIADAHLGDLWYSGVLGGVPEGE